MITASAQLLQMLPPEARRESEVERLQTIIRSAERMDRLIGDLLDISRIEAAHFSVERAPVDTAPLLEEACEVLRSRAEKKALELRCEMPEDLPPLAADRDRILQVLENRVGNAVEFTPEGGRITLRAQPKDTEVQFSVSDTGPGIAEEQRARLFDPYWQAKKGTAEGVGLGLPISEGPCRSARRQDLGGKRSGRGEYVSLHGAAARDAVGIDVSNSYVFGE